jgi:hypothetical protein
MLSYTVPVIHEVAYAVPVQVEICIDIGPTSNEVFRHAVGKKHSTFVLPSQQAA